ncbi:MAG: hypothetical protein ACSLFO_06745 [Acidimicrobiales bacterium]
MSTDDRSAQDERSTRDEVMAVVRVVAGRGWALAGTGAHALNSGADDAVRVLVGRRVQRALRPGATAVTTEDLVEALGTRSGPRLSPWIGAGAARLARTGRTAKVLGGRTPLGFAVLIGPALYAAVTSNLRGLDASIAHLAGRARHRKVDPDPERLRRVVVQALAGDPVDPDVDADHGALIRVWLSDAGRQAVPFGLDRISGLGSGRTPEAVAAVLGAVNVTRLARQ